ncbi:unnamed protein product [Nesidiocoris tenuis]|uniref:Uncharacterized protein n=1 Tax=Nesidiocoris tenuis TaxID=355587 RepID=A0A6H5G127_9HEMI|nr:unnamed protein product [Nesidiocoris tenuis]
MFGYPASANRLFAASVFRRLPSGSFASRSPKQKLEKVSCCGNILWFEKCNTSEYAAGGHRLTRSDAAKQQVFLYFPPSLTPYMRPPLANLQPRAGKRRVFVEDEMEAVANTIGHCLLAVPVCGFEGVQGYALHGKPLLRAIHTSGFAFFSRNCKFGFWTAIVLCDSQHNLIIIIILLVIVICNDE